MKTKLFFASALLVGMGMVSSCSNDDVAVAPGVTPGAGDADLVPIELALGNPTVSVQKRGSGTVGDIASAEATNVWNGQNLYVLMTRQDDASTADENEFGLSTWTYESANPATDPNVDQDPYVNDPTATIINFDNELIKAPASGASGALAWTTGPKYYPTEGTHDFFAYHISDAFTDEEPAGALDSKPDVKDETNGKQKYVEFEINGTQDLMAGKAEWKHGQDDDFATLYPDLNQTTDLFTARSARAGVIPNIVMQHLLSRFTFTVEGMGSGAEGLQVTSIEVKSKATGKMYVAYDPTAVPENLIVFDDTQVDAYSTFTLMQVDADRADANADLETLEPVTIEKAAGGTPGEDGVNADGYAPQRVGDAIMVAPGDATYSLTVYVQQTFDDDNPATEPENHPAGVYPYSLTINIPNATGGTVTEKSVAQSGASYNVNIKLYGLEKIELETTLTGWEDGGNIDIDTNAPAGGVEEDPEP